MKKLTPRDLSQALLDGWNMALDDDTMPEEWESLTFPIMYQGEGYERPLKRSNDDAEG